MAASSRVASPMPPTILALAAAGKRSAGGGRDLRFFAAAAAAAGVRVRPTRGPGIAAPPGATGRRGGRRGPIPGGRAGRGRGSSGRLTIVTDGAAPPGRHSYRRFRMVRRWLPAAAAAVVVAATLVAGPARAAEPPLPRFY